MFPLPSQFGTWGLQIKQTKGRLTGEKAQNFIFTVTEAHRKKSETQINGQTQGLIYPFNKRKGVWA